MFECPFVVGQRVTPIPPAKWQYFPRSWKGAWEFFWQRKPAKGNVCTVNHIEVAYGQICLSFKEFDGRYGYIWFRPLIEPKINISVFETLLAEVNAGKVKPVTEPVDA